MAATLEYWKQRARQLKTELHALALAYRDPRTPQVARACAAVVVGYAFSPVDLIPDPIPVLGYLDDLVLIPLGIALARRLIPPQVMADCRAQAQDAARRAQPVNWITAGVIVAIWIALAALAIRLIV
jgi:uncharacterized membrane protein YkvA (DUF1232 family)